jgi:hypothetical protein
MGIRTAVPGCNRGYCFIGYIAGALTLHEYRAWNAGNYYSIEFPATIRLFRKPFLSRTSRILCILGLGTPSLHNSSSRLTVSTGRVAFCSTSGDTEPNQPVREGRPSMGPGNDHPAPPASTIRLISFAGSPVTRKDRDVKILLFGGHPGIFQFLTGVVKDTAGNLSFVLS